MQGANALLNIVTIPPGATKTQQRIVIDGVRGAIFEYVNGGPAGALVSSWASKAGTDPYGNAYPAGFNIGPNSVFAGTNFVLNSSGLFFYSGTPALGNLILSLAPAAGTDSFGNVFPIGFAVFGVFGGNTYQTSMGLIGNIPALFFQNLTSPASPVPSVAAQMSSSGGAELVLQSGGNQPGGIFSSLSIQDPVFSGIANGQILISTGQVNFLSAGTGPFIQGEGFHGVTLAANWAGQLRVKKLPWNAVKFNCQINATAATAGGVSITFGSLPDLSYYPFFSSHFPCAMTGAAVLTSGSFLGTVRWNFPNSGVGGAIHLEIPSLSASAAITVGCDLDYPTN